MTFSRMNIESMTLISIYGYAMTAFLSVALSNVFLCIGVACGIFLIKKRRSWLFIPQEYINAIMVFFIIGLVSACMANDLSDSFNRYVKMLLRLSMVFLVLIAVKSQDEIKKVINFMMISSIIAAVTAIFQGLAGDYRAAVFFSNAMYYAGFLVQIIPILMILAIKDTERVKIYMIALALSILALIFNGTRGAWLTVVIIAPVVLVLCQVKIKRLLLSFTAVSICAAILFMANPNLSNRLNTLTDLNYQSNSERILLWRSAIAMWYDNPVFGVGVGNFESSYRAEYISPLAKERGLGHPHNNLLAALSEMGIVGAGAYLFYVGTFMTYSLKEWRAKNNIYALMLFSATLGLFLQGMTESNFGNSVVMNFYYMILGLFFVSLRYDSQHL